MNPKIQLVIHIGIIFFNIGLGIGRIENGNTFGFYSLLFGISWIGLTLFLNNKKVFETTVEANSQ